MNVINVTDATFADEYSASTSAIRDFLHMYFEISGDCRPFGDYDRAELGSVDPFRFLDIHYVYKYQFRSDAEITFMHQAAAINLLCRLAQTYDTDECSGSTVMADFCDLDTRRKNELPLRECAPDLFRIYEAYCEGRIVDTPSIQEAFHAAFKDQTKFYFALGGVLTEVILKTFDNLG